MAGEWRLLVPRIMKSLVSLSLAILLAAFVTSCKDAPGADGRYAHGYGYLYQAGGGRWAP
jgi:hypothetical protein